MYIILIHKSIFTITTSHRTTASSAKSIFCLKMSILALNIHILLMPLIRLFRKIVNNSKNYVLTMPMTMSFKDLKYFSCDKLGFFLFVCLWSEVLQLEKFIIFVFRNVDSRKTRLHGKRIAVPRKMLVHNWNLTYLQVKGIY